MPRLPILSREAFYTTNPDGSIRLLDFCLVNTSLGAMIEPYPVLGVNGDKIAPIDAKDAGFSRLVPTNADQFYSQTGFSGEQVLRDFAR